MTEKKDKIIKSMMHVVIAVYGLGCLWLYYHQSIVDLAGAPPIPYQSDLPLHISMIIEDGWYYSFTAYAYKALYVLFGGSTIGIALLLTVCSVSVIYVTEHLIRYWGGFEDTSSIPLVLAFFSNIVMPIYVESWGFYRYVSYQSANIWHNSTYICMKVVALITFFYYFKLEKKYREGISWKEWLVFAGLNVIATGIKPSFLLAFSPIMGIFLFVDLIKKVPLKKILIFGSAMLPSGAVVLWQNAVLFGENTGNGMTIKPWYTFSLHANNPKLTAFLSVAFCAIVLLVTCRNLFKNRQYLFVVLMSALGFLEASCLVESGSRAVDGNFLWGYSFCLFVLFIYTGIRFVRYKRDTWIHKIIFFVMAALYVWHIICGLEFFIRLVSGETYWMTY